MTGADRGGNARTLPISRRRVRRRRYRNAPRDIRLKRYACTSVVIKTRSLWRRNDRVFMTTEAQGARIQAPLYGCAFLQLYSFLMECISISTRRRLRPSSPVPFLSRSFRCFSSAIGHDMLNAPVLVIRMSVLVSEARNTTPAISSLALARIG